GSPGGEFARPATSATGPVRRSARTSPAARLRQPLLSLSSIRPVPIAASSSAKSAGDRSRLRAIERAGLCANEWAARISRMSRAGHCEIDAGARPKLLGLRRFHFVKGNRCPRSFGPETEVPNRQDVRPEGARFAGVGVSSPAHARWIITREPNRNLKRQKLCASPGFALLPYSPPLHRPGTFFGGAATDAGGAPPAAMFWRTVCGGQSEQMFERQALWKPETTGFHCGTEQPPCPMPPRYIEQRETRGS